MKAQIIQEFGPTNQFKSVEMPMPEIGPRQVLIQVKATSVNPIDTKIRSGKVGIFAPEFPAVLHGDVAGVVSRVGSLVDSFQVGDRVFGCAGGVKGTGGALGEYMAADPDTLAIIPENLSFAEAASVPLVAITAWEGLVDKARLQPGDRLLVIGGVGGVGQMAIQLGRAMGAIVDTTASSDEKEKLARDLGAESVVNYKKENLSDFVAKRTQGEGYDVVFNTVGGQSLQDSFSLVKPNGKLIFIGIGESNNLGPAYVKGLSLLGVLMLIPLLSGKGRAHHGDIMKRIGSLITAGTIRPLIDPVRFDFDQVAQAHERLESGRALGKIVISRE